MITTILSNLTPYFNFDIDSNIENTRAIFLNYLNKYPKISSVFETSNKNFQFSKYHQENLEEHFIACGVACQLYAEKFYNFVSEDISITKEEFVNLSLLLGLFHDIGKPFSAAKVSPKKSKVIYTGHSQLSSRIMEEFIDNLEPTQNFALLWAINHHMCHCTHCHISDFSAQHHCYDQLISDLDSNIQKKNLSIALLCVIAFGDMVARSDTTQEMNFDTIHNYSLNLYQKLIYHIPEKKSSYLTIIHTLGVSGSGKSYFSNKISRQFSDKYDISIVERDNALRNVYSSLYSDTNIPYHQMYSTIYQREDGKQIVQNQWIKELNFALMQDNGKQRIIIVDTCQTLFPKAWENTLSALEEDAKANYNTATKICFYTVPWHYFNNEYETKTQTYATLPLDFGGFWVNLQHEREKIDSCYEYGTGAYVLLQQYIVNNINESFTVNTEYEQKNLSQILNSYNYNNFTDVCNAFVKSYPFIEWRVEQETQNYKLIVFTYQDGLQQFNLETRDYRGEGVIYNMMENKFYIVRPNLPVFPEMTQIANDHKALPYIAKDASKITNIQGKAVSLCKNIAPKTPQLIYTVPKYDGSLFNLTFIPIGTYQYNMILDICNSCVLPPTSWYFDSENSGIFLIGSKGTCFSKAPVNTRIHKSVIGSYGNIYNFLIKAKQILCCENTNYAKTITTLHFEALDVTPTPELTVYYGYSACPFFGLTIYDNDNDKKTFKLPTIQNDKILVAPIKQFNCFSDIIKSFDSNYAELLNGNTTIEPEGFVVHLFDGETWIPIKYKYALYYIAHKPDSIKNQNFAKELMTNPIYEKVIPRLLKFREKPPIKSFLENVNFTTNIISCLDKFTGQTKKDWALFWKNEQNLSEITILLTQVIEQIKLEYPYVDGFEKNAFKFVMLLFDYKSKSIDDINKSIHNFFEI